jgi:hypothetical protein
MNSFSIFVNTTDNFEDCWMPFFTLFQKYWHDYEGVIYLNTEKKNFSFPGLNIRCVKNGLTNSMWSDCLIYGLNKIDNDYLLYMQDDYFIKSDVKSGIIYDLFKLVYQNKIDCLHLTDQSSPGPFNKNTSDNRLWEILPGAKYRISTQAAFWNKKSFVNFVDSKCTGWEFECNANTIITTQTTKIYTLNQQLFQINKNELLPYIFTGIIRGKWKKEVKELFSDNNIVIDYSKRGFYKPPNFFMRIINKIRKLTK